MHTLRQVSTLSLYLGTYLKLKHTVSSDTVVFTQKFLKKKDILWNYWAREQYKP